MSEQEGNSENVEEQTEHITVDAIRALLARQFVSFRPEFARIGKGTALGSLGAKAAIMLSQALYISEKNARDDGWFPYTIDDWEELTGLTYTEQVTARRDLIRHGVWEEGNFGAIVRINGKERKTQGQMHYRVNYVGLKNRLNESVNRHKGNGGSSPTSAHKPDNSVFDAPKPAKEIKPKRTGKNQAFGKPKTIVQDEFGRIRGNRKLVVGEADAKVSEVTQAPPIRRLKLEETTTTSNTQESTAAEAEVVVSSLNSASEVSIPVVIETTIAATASDTFEDLIAELIANDIGEGDAHAIAAKMPEACRRQLDWLPFQIYREGNRGGFLYKAITGGYSEPAKARAARLAAERATKRAQAEAERVVSPDPETLERQTVELQRAQATAKFDAMMAADQAAVLERAKVDNLVAQRSREPEAQRLISIERLRAEMFDNLGAPTLLRQDSAPAKPAETRLQKINSSFAEATKFFNELPEETRLVVLARTRAQVPGLDEETKTFATHRNQILRGMLATREILMPDEPGESQRSAAG